MVMKILTVVLAVLLVAALGAAAMFYLQTYQPLTTDYARMKEDMAALNKTKAELAKIKEKENRETAWLNPVIDGLSKEFGDEIKAGEIEVLAAGNRLIVNIAEDALYLSGSYTFSKESPKLRGKLVSFLKKSELKGKDICIGNTTESTPAQRRGRKAIPPKDARTLAAERSAVLIKDFEKNGVDQSVLIGAAFAPKNAAAGFKLKDRKTIIIIESPIAGPAVATKQGAAQGVPATATAPTATQKMQPKTIPIKPAQPKTN